MSILLTKTCTVIFRRELTGIFILKCALIVRSPIKPIRSIHQIFFPFPRYSFPSLMEHEGVAIFCISSILWLLCVVIFMDEWREYGEKFHLQSTEERQWRKQRGNKEKKRKNIHRLRKYFNTDFTLTALNFHFLFTTLRRSVSNWFLVKRKQKQFVEPWVELLIRVSIQLLFAVYFISFLKFFYLRTRCKIIIKNLYFCIECVFVCVLVWV